MRADYDVVIASLEGRDDLDSSFLRLRTLCRLGRNDEAYEEVLRILGLATSAEDRLVAEGLRIAALARRGDLEGALRRATEVRPAVWPTPYAQAEFSYAVAFVAYMHGEYDLSQSLLGDAYACPNADLIARAKNLEAFIAAARGDFRRHTELLLESFSTFAEQRDVYAKAHTVLDISIMARETKFPIDADALERAYDSIEWTYVLADWRYLTCKNLAWRRALDGSYLAAYRLLERSIAMTCSRAWIAWSHADFAQFAAGAGEVVTARMHRDKAVEMALSVDWEHCSGEERSALLEIATLTAEDDPETSASLMRRYDGLFDLSPELAFVHDARAAAEYEVAVGLQPPHTPDRIARLAAASNTFAGFGYTWRAGVAAAAIARFTGDHAWAESARTLLGAYPASWIARELRDRRALIHERFPALSPRQVLVADLMTQGLSDKQIAAKINLAWNTVRNHATAVLAKTGSHSRRALEEIVKSL